ncbi:MAG TPA: glycosyltransferase family 39 protein [Ktedonobacterales bacterium]|nr:glycosyltransferase family 39 protein [Ktedonobacterales bacterium]
MPTTFMLASQREAARAALRRHGAPLALALVAGAALRLIWLGDTSFLGDQAELLALGRSAADHHALIITGILSSIGTLNPPISAWPYAPFAALGGPVAASAFTALVNILAIALLYILATRYGGRRAGFVAALLYATASGPVHYSRFIWQQNLMAPALLLLLGAILAGLIERRAGWLGWAALFWGIAIQLHPTSAALLVVIAFALALTWRSLRWRDAGWAAVALAALFAPTLLWELVSHGFDLAAFTAFSSRPSIIDPAAPFRYSQLITPASSDTYGAGSSYEAMGSSLGLLAAAMVVLALFSGIWLCAIAVNPWISDRREHGGPRAAMASPRWRLAVTLLLWQVTPVLLLLRHSRIVPEHYLLVLLPIVYFTIGLWAASLSRWIESRAAARWIMAPRVGLVVITLALAAAQTVGVSAELSTIHSGSFSGLAIPLHYGIPLSSEQATLTAAGTAARRDRAALYIASTRTQQEPYGYLAQTGATPATVYISDGCLMVPSPDSAQSLVTLALPETLAFSALPRMTGVQSLGALHAQGSKPLALYALRPGAGLRGEVGLPGTTSDTGPHPAAYSYTTDATGKAYLTVRWTGAPTLAVPTGRRASYWFGAAPSGPLPANYTVTAQPLDSAGKPAGVSLTADCGRLAWQRGTDVLAWLPLPSGSRDSAAVWSVSLKAGPLAALRPQIGPLPLETGAVYFTTEQPLAGPFTFQARSGA